MDNNFFKNIEGKTGVNMKDVFRVGKLSTGSQFQR